MKKIFINNLKFLKILKENKILLYHISIDLFFYLYISIGFFFSAYITFLYEFNTKIAAIIWTIGFILIFALKIKKDFKW